MTGFAGFGQGVSNAINANSQNNQQDAQTEIIQLHQEAMRRSQAGDVWGARALKLMADQIGGTAGFGGPPAPPGAQPPMPGTQSMPAQQPQAMQGPVVQPMAPQPPMQGVPLPPYQSLQSLAPEVAVNASTTPDREGFVPVPSTMAQNVLRGDSAEAPTGKPQPVGTITGDISALYPGAADQPGGVPPPPPAASPVAGAAAPGTPGAPVSPPGSGAQPGAQAPMQMGPNGLPQGPQLAGNLNALNAIKALKSIGAPDDVIMSALGHMEPIFATEYKATIAAQNSAIHAYQATMQSEIARVRAQDRDEDRASRETIAANKNKETQANREVRKNHYDQQSQDYRERSRTMQQRVDKMPNPNSADAQAFRYAKQLSDKAHADLHSLYSTLAKTTDETMKAGLDSQINAKQAEIDNYTRSMVDAYNKLDSGTPLSSQQQGSSPTQQGVPLPPKPAGGGAKGTNGWKIERVQ